MPPAGRVKRTMRQVVDRLAMPYVDAVVERLRAPEDENAREVVPRVFVELPLTLHEARTLALADMPAGAATLLSVGASGSWYLDWIEQNYGHVARHIAVERFSPEPEDLPASVEWLGMDIAEVLSRSSLTPGSLDLIYSGQNIEHLWPDQLVSFLAASHELLRDGGWLVVDSPNRDLTREYNWSMAEHTVEFLPEEATHMLRLAGFEVARMKGLWLGREGNCLLPLDPALDAGGAASVLRRMVLATDRPADSFIWWAEARKHGRPDTVALRAYVGELFESHWPERLNRLLPGPEAAVTNDGGAESLSLAPGLVGEVMTGPRMALPAGDYTFGIELRARQRDGRAAPGTVGTFAVRAGEQVLASREIVPDAGDTWVRLHLDVTLPETRFDVGIQVVSDGTAGVDVRRSLEVQPEPWAAPRAT